MYKPAVVRRLLDRRMIRRGWRPSYGVPVGEPYWLNCHFGYDEETLIKQAVAKVSSHTMVSFERLATLWQQVRYLDKHRLPGALVECGTWRGGSAGMMALAHLHSSRAAARALHLFDSFQGLPEPEAEKDGASAVDYSHGSSSGKLAPIGRCVASRDECSALLEERLSYPRERLHYHVGWFQQTVPLAARELGAIALLRLDGDWYESTRLCLENLYPQVVEGGVVVIDDYGHWEGCRRAVDEFLEARRERVMLHHIDYSGRYWIRCGA